MTRFNPAKDEVIYPLPSILERIDPQSWFPAPQPLEVELGCGDGSFLAALAQRVPGHNFLGVERLLGRVQKTARKASRAGIGNLRVVRIESSYFLGYLLPPGSASAIHIYFPDPWPKRKHRRHRLVNDAFPAVAAAALVSGGRVYLRTDDQDYFDQMTAVFQCAPQFKPAETPANLSGILTDFERGFQSRGIATLRAAFEARIAGQM